MTRNGEASGDAPAGASDDRLQPFEVGRTWTYARSVPDPTRPGGCAGPLESSISGSVTQGNDAGWLYNPTCRPGPLTMFMQGDAIWTFLGPDQRFDYAVPPVVEGASFDSGGGLIDVWHDAGTVSVPAGSFEHCWRRTSAADAEEYIVLCRGTGLVIVNAVLENDRLELIDKNF